MSRDSVIVALSGGVDSAVAALLLRDAGYSVECLHMTNWDDDGYCDAAAELRDAARVCKVLDLPLHRVNFAREYRQQVFAHFLDELEAGRTPNPDVLCNREIKFGAMRDYARRLGSQYLATGHYARIGSIAGRPALFKSEDASKDQTYFLHAVDAAEFEEVLFPLAGLRKAEVRRLAQQARLEVSGKKDSTGICFIGERPFAEFLTRYVSATPGNMRDAEGKLLGQHRGLAFYTVGQRRGLGIGGLTGHDDAPWYVAQKDVERNELIVVQGEHPLLYSRGLVAGRAHWIGEPPPGFGTAPELPHLAEATPAVDYGPSSPSGHLAVAAANAEYRCSAKVRYRQPDQPCTIRIHDGSIQVAFDTPQRAVTAGQYVVFYAGDRCLGGATIEQSLRELPPWANTPKRQADTAAATPAGKHVSA